MHGRLVVADTSLVPPHPIRSMAAVLLGRRSTRPTAGHTVVVMVVDRDANDRLIAALTDLAAVTDALTAGDELDSATLEVFWREWPQVRDWGDVLWRRMDEDLAVPSTEAVDADLDETGGGD